MESTPRWLGYIAADHELLAGIDAPFHPQPTSAARLVDAVGTLGDDTFQSVALHEGEHLFRGLAGYLRNADVSVRLDCRFEDFASFRECLLRQILATSDEHIERIEHDVGLASLAGRFTIKPRREASQYTAAPYDPSFICLRSSCNCRR